MIFNTKPKLYRESEVEEPDESRKELALKAKTLLGYSVLEQTIPNRSSSEVSAVFKKLGIEPLNESQVQKYQRWYRQKHSGAFDWERVHWESARIENYAEPMPEFVLSRAVELKEHLPNAVFSIEFPVREERVRPDPFLVMYYAGIRYYIDVWDEPKFEGRRTV